MRREGRFKYVGVRCHDFVQAGGDVMAKLLPASVLTRRISIALGLLACGGGTPTRQLLFVTVTPQTATASDCPNGMVQLTGTGTYDRAPSPAPVTPANWDLDPASTSASNVVSITPSGMTQCKAGFAGTGTVRGGGFVCPANSMMGVPCHLVLGTAQLTCP